MPGVEALSLSEAVGQLICPTLFHGTQPYDEARTLADLARCSWGGYIVFRGDFETTRSRVASVQSASRIPLLVAADMEYGAGQQVSELTSFPLVMAFGAADDPALAHDLGAWTAIEAARVGVNWIFAPVADVTNNPLNPIISTRSFGGDPARVGAMVAAYVKGCQAQGALACAKHFPGHGDTGTDSHTRLGSVPADRARLEAVELPPFRAALAADVASIMTAHLALPALGVHGPATLSPAVMTGLLRDELGFEGLVVTDALVMGGITGTVDPVEAAIQAIAAGCDMLLMPPDPVATWEALKAGVESGRLSRERVYQAAGRVFAAKARLERPKAPPPALSPDALRDRVARQALTLAKGAADFRVPEGALAIAVDDGVEPDRLVGWRQALKTHGLVDGGVIAVDGETDWSALQSTLAGAPMVVLGVFSPIRIHKDRSLLPASLVDHLNAIVQSTPTAAVSLSSPFLLVQFPEAVAWVLTFGTRPYQVEALMAALRAGGPFPGHMPVALPNQVEAPKDATATRPIPRGASFT